MFYYVYWIVMAYHGKQHSNCKPSFGSSCYIFLIYWQSESDKRSQKLCSFIIFSSHSDQRTRILEYDFKKPVLLMFIKTIWRWYQFQSIAFKRRLFKHLNLNLRVTPPALKSINKNGLTTIALATYLNNSKWQ